MQIANFERPVIRPSILILLTAWLVSCGGGGGSTEPSAAPQSVGNNAGTESRLLTQTSTGRNDPDAQLLGARDAVDLPKSSYSLSYLDVSDEWSVSTVNGATSDFLRLSGDGVVSFFDRRSPQKQVAGGFDIKALPGVSSPHLYGVPKPSPDGQYIIGYWKANYQSDDPLLTVFDRVGNIVLQVPNKDYAASLVTSAVDWLPDGRFVFLADDLLVIGRPDQVALKTLPLGLPANVSVANAELWSSPGGDRVLLSLTATLPNSGGLGVKHKLLYLVDVDGGNFHALTALSQRAQQSGTVSTHGRATWSDDGKRVLFVVDHPVADAGDTLPSWSNGCPVVMVVPSDARGVAIDGLNDAQDRYFTDVIGGAYSPKGKVNSCSGSLAWVKPVAK